MKSAFLRLVLPDFHGKAIDPMARAAVIRDTKLIKPKQIAWLGDGVDCGGIFSKHAPGHVGELEYCYEEDCDAAESFIEDVTNAAGDPEQKMVEGNHELHVERFIAQTWTSKRDAKAVRTLIAPDTRLKLKKRGIKFYRSALFHDGLTINGAFKWGKCHFTHGFTAAKFATAIHVARFGSNVVHGHTHRAQEYRTRTVNAGVIGGWSPGCLCRLQPLYMHGSPTEWSLGYGLQLVEPNGEFLHINVPIVNGRTMVDGLLKTIKPRRMYK